MRVIFRTTAKLLKICELRESLLDVDEKFRNQFFRRVLAAVREGEISLHNEQGFTVSLDDLKRLARAATRESCDPIYKMALTKPEDILKYTDILNDYISFYHVLFPELSRWLQDKHGFEVTSDASAAASEMTPGAESDACLERKEADPLSNDDESHEQAESIDDTDSTRERRANHDMAREKGTRLLILENWDRIESERGASANGYETLRELRKIVGDSSSRLRSLKSIQNRLVELRNEKLIPCKEKLIP